MGQLSPRIESLELGPTTESSMLMRTTVNFTNPTKYFATVPLFDVMLLYNSTAVAHMTARDVSVVPGNNSGVQVDLLWNPLDSGGSSGVNAGRELVSQYISGRCSEFPALSSCLTSTQASILLPRFKHMKGQYQRFQNSEKRCPSWQSKFHSPRCQALDFLVVTKVNPMMDNRASFKMQRYCPPFWMPFIAMDTE